MVRVHVVWECVLRVLLQAYCVKRKRQITEKLQLSLHQSKREDVKNIYL